MSADPSVAQLKYFSEGTHGVADLLTTYFPERLKDNIDDSLISLYNKLYDELTQDEKEELENQKQYFSPPPSKSKEELENTLSEYNEKLESYVSGYYSIEETKKRFESMPDTLDLMLESHAMTKQAIEEHIDDIKRFINNNDSPQYPAKMFHLR